MCLTDPGDRHVAERAQFPSMNCFVRVQDWKTTVLAGKDPFGQHMRVHSHYHRQCECSKTLKMLGFPHYFDDIRVGFILTLAVSGNALWWK